MDVIFRFSFNNSMPFQYTCKMFVQKKHILSKKAILLLTYYGLQLIYLAFFFLFQFLGVTYTCTHGLFSRVNHSPIFLNPLDLLLNLFIRWCLHFSRNPHLFKHWKTRHAGEDSLSSHCFGICTSYCSNRFRHLLSAETPSVSFFFHSTGENK